MFFYLFIPILFIKIKSTKKSLILILVAIITSNILRLIAQFIIERFTNLDYKLLSGTTFYFWLPNQFPVFCFGIFLFYFLKSNKVSFITQRISLFASILLFLFFSQVKFSSEFPFHFFQKEYVFSLIFGLLIVGIHDFKFNNFIGNIFLKIGKYSFSMYLSHFFILRIFSYVAINYFGFEVNDKFFILSYLIVVCISYICSSFLFKIEMFGIRCGNRLISKIRAKRQLSSFSQIEKNKY